MANDRPEINLDGILPEGYAPPEGLLVEQAPKDKPPLDLSMFRDTDEESVLPEGARNTMAGVHSGVANQNFTANIGTYLESKLPMGRLFSENKEGETEFWQSTPEWLGISEEEWDSMSGAKRRIAITKNADREIAEHWNADTDSTGYMLGQFAGMLIDPTTAIPILGQTKLARTATGSAIGGADVAAYETAHKGAPTVGGTALGMGVGGLAGRFLGGKGGDAAVADQQIELFNKIYPHQQKMTDDIGVAYKNTLDQMGIDETLMQRITKSSDKAQVMKPVGRSDAAKMVDAELQALQTGKSKIGEGATGQLYNKVFQPISDRFKAINPRVWMKIQDQQRKSMQLGHDTMLKVDPFLRKVERLKMIDKDAYRAMHKAMFYGEGDIEKLASKHLGDTAMGDLELYRSAMDNMYRLSKEVNPKLTYKKDYFPRWVKDYDAIKKHLGTEDKARVSKIVSAEAKKLGRGEAGLTKEELNDVYNKYVQGFYDTEKVTMTPGGVKKRRIKDLPDEIIEKAYAAPAASAHSYIKQMSTDVYRKKMFGDKVTKAHGDNITDSIGAMAGKYGNTADDIDELKTLMNLLYVQGTRSPNKFVTAFKDLGYASMLGNPLSAITQIGDIFISASKIGGANTMSGLAKALTGRGLTPKEFGLMDNVIEELVSTGPTKKILDKALDWGQFKRIDGIGKATLMNGALRKMHKQAGSAQGLTQLRKKWGKAFGDDWGNVENALRNKDINPDIKSMVFAELADIQPITLMEMPEIYLKHPNGRVAYMLKTFTMKYLNLLRRDMVDKFAQGDRKQAIINGALLISALNLGGIATDELKDIVLNRDSKLDDLVTDNLLKTTGLFNRYSMEKIGKSAKPLTTAVGSLAPPLGWMDPAARAMYQFTTTGAVPRETRAGMAKTLPVIGKLWHNYGLGGLEEHRRNQ